MSIYDELIISKGVDAKVLPDNPRDLSDICNISDDFVILRDSNGDEVIRYGDSIWNFRSLKKGFQFKFTDFSEKINNELRILCAARFLFAPNARFISSIVQSPLNHLASWATKNVTSQKVLANYSSINLQTRHSRANVRWFFIFTSTF